ncbi:MAG: NPCBM/NEW2 domain-containing protein [Phycisphaerae bacterium]|nr:NPCBM/NEW2 domain-containing protein [Phycisphaerae bacterium]
MTRHVAMAVAAAGACAALAAGGQVERIDARQLDGHIVSLDDQTLVLRDGETRRTVPRDALARVTLAAAADPMTHGTLVLTSVTGDVLPLSELTLVEERLVLRSGLLGRAELPLAAASVLYQPPEAMTTRAVQRKCEEMALTRQAQDVLVLPRGDGNWLTVSGALKALDDETITFHWKGRDRTFARKRVAAIYFARAPREAPKPAGTVRARDGTQVAFDTLALDAEHLTVSGSELGTCRIARKDVAEIRFRSGRVVPLGQLEPVRVTQHGVFETFAYRVDAAAGGGPLRLDGRTYPHGLGLHSFCELTWALDEEFVQLVAVVGIDDAVRPHGEAVVSFLGDGEPLGEPWTVAGTDEARPVRLDVAGVRRLTIRVDYGPNDLDVADHVDLASARLIKAVSR